MALPVCSSVHLHALTSFLCLTYLLSETDTYPLIIIFWKTQEFHMINLVLHIMSYYCKNKHFMAGSVWVGVWPGPFTSQASVCCTCLGSLTAGGWWEWRVWGTADKQLDLWPRSRGGSWDRPEHYFTLSYHLNRGLSLSHQPRSCCTT